MPGRPGLSPLRIDTVHEVTPAQLETIRELGDQLGLEALRQQRIQMGFGFAPDDPGLVPLGDMLFRAAATPAIRMRAKAADLDAIARWVREARAGSDLVLASLHAHEQAGSKEQPAEFIQPFARRMIEEGADLVVGHGPHLLRGIEIYRGKPIFYSLGNFIGQNELVGRLPSDSYERFRADAGMTPLMVYRQRTADDTRGFPSDARFWESVVPICSFEDGLLARMELHPVSLGLGEKPHRRGRPRLASGEHGRRILGRMAELSRPFGTDFPIEGNKAVWTA
jgi:poly-gamma-glutamate synthesis protein (capsule biosynthesis protein)